MVALARSAGYVYMVGTPNGRFGNAYLARVPEQQVLDKKAWRYWDGRSWSGAYHRYRLSACVRTAENNSETVLGVRGLRGRTIAERVGGAHPEYTKVSVDFTSGRESLVQLYAGFFGHGQDVWLQVDDVVLEELR
jgi:hypothetical protein